jgi:hypothetical protein
MVLRRPARAHTLQVCDGTWIHRGEPLTDGAIDHAELARALGFEPFAAHLIAEVRDLLYLGGARVRETQVELVVRALLAKVVVLDAGASRFLPGEVLPREVVVAENERLRAAGLPEVLHESSFTAPEWAARDAFSPSVGTQVVKLDARR